MADGDRKTGPAGTADRIEGGQEGEGTATPSVRELLSRGSYPIGGTTPQAPERKQERRRRDAGPRVEYFGDGMISPGLTRNRFVLKEYREPEPSGDENDLGPEYTFRHHLPEILTIIGAILFVIIATL